MKTVMTVSPRTIAGMLKIAAQKDVRYYLNGVYIEPETGVLVTTDGHVLLAHRTDASVPDVAPFVIPGDLLANVVKSRCASVRISIGGGCGDPDKRDRSIALECGIGSGDDFVPTGATFTAKEIDGLFPEWRRVVPKETTGEAAQFDATLLERMQTAMAEIYLGNAKKTHYVRVHHNGPTGGALVTCADGDTVGVVMPVREVNACEPRELLERFAIQQASAALAPDEPERRAA